MNINNEIFPDVFSVYNYLTKEKGWSFGFHTPPQFEVMTLNGNRGQAPVPVLKISKLRKNTLISTEKEASCIIKYGFAMAVLRGRDSYS